MNKKLGIICTLSMTLILSIALSGCAKTENKPVTANNEVKQEETKKPTEVKQLKVGYASGSGSLFSFIAEEKGLFKKEGLEVELVPFSNSSDALNAINAGKIDIGTSFGTAGPMTFITKGTDFTLFGGQLSGGHPIVTTKENANKLKTIQDYKGKKVASPRIYTPDVVWRSAMFNANIDIKKDLQLIEMKKPSEVIEAVKAGKADVGIATISVYTQAKEAGLEIVGWSNDLWPEHVCCRLVANTSFVNENNDAVKAYLRALVQAQKIFEEDPNYGVQVNVKYLKIDEQMAKDLTLEPHQIYEIDPKKNQMVEMFKMMNEIGYIQSDIDIEKHINTDLYKQTIDELSKENVDSDFYKKLQKIHTENN